MTPTPRRVPAAHQRASAAKSNPAARANLIRIAIHAIFKNNPEFPACSHAFSPDPATQHAPADYLFATADDPRTPEAVFNRLRWGGQFVYISPDPAAAAEVEARFNQREGFVIECPTSRFRAPFLRLQLPYFSKILHYVIARKTLLVPAGRFSDRFTYHVELLRHPSFGPDYVVMKQVPTLERVIARLQEKFPNTDADMLRKRARKFTDTVFPLFLTREAGILRILQESLPEPYKSRVPRVIAVEKDSQGYVRTLYLNWLRNAPPLLPTGPGSTEVKPRPLTQIEFAQQSAEMLAAMHDIAKVMHLDLRLDNFVITRRGVGFVDFGSAVRVGETITDSALLTNLFDEMMRTSQIQRMLGRMQDAGQVTSPEIRNSYGRIDKAVDFFYLAVQINAPLSNPDFKGLVQHHPDSPESDHLESLTAEILRPKNPDRPAFKSARDILRGILDVQRLLGIPQGRSGMHLPPLHAATSH